MFARIRHLASHTERYDTMAKFYATIRKKEMSFRPQGKIFLGSLHSLARPALPVT